MDIDKRTAIVEESLSRNEIHEDWESAYRTPGHEAVTDLIFEHMLRAVDAPADAVWLDVGCGPGFHSLRLARAGYRVRGLDIADQVLETARRNRDEAGFAERVEFATGNVLDLPFADGSVDFILCWGVLMHVPDIEGAVRELSRVLRPGGRLAISESNLASWENLVRAAADRVGGSDVRRKRTEAGIERWFEIEGGTLLTRQCDQDWLEQAFAREGLVRRDRFAAPLTGAYTKLQGPAAGAIHRLNAFWIRFVRAPGPAQGNLVVFERPGG